MPVDKVEENVQRQRQQLPDLQKGNLFIQLLEELGVVYKFDSLMILFWQMKLDLSLSFSLSSIENFKKVSLEYCKLE